VSIDTRTIKAGELFVAIRGERFDGADFVGAAVAAGARRDRRATRPRRDVSRDPRHGPSSPGSRLPIRRQRFRRWPARSAESPARRSSPSQAARERRRRRK